MAVAETDNRGIKNIMNQAEISLILDTYDDIFSDFDPRPYSDRALSEDFLSEARKAALDKKEGVVLHFLIPKAVRNTASEDLIRLRLKNHFRRHYKIAMGELAARRRRGVELMAIGAVVGVANVLLVTYSGISAVLKNSLDIILTPASWYTIWMGFDDILTKPKDIAASMRFHKKMADAQVNFTAY